MVDVNSSAGGAVNTKQSAFAVLFGLSAVGLGPNITRADTLTFDVSATFSSPSNPSYGLSGMFTVDETAAIPGLTFADLTVTGFTSPENSFDTTSINGFQYPSDSSIEFQFVNTSGYFLVFTVDFSPPDTTGSNIVHFPGGNIVSGSFSDGLIASGLTGIVALSTTPLPAALPLFATGLGSLGLLGWRRRQRAQVPA